MNTDRPAPRERLEQLVRQVEQRRQAARPTEEHARKVVEFGQRLRRLRRR